MEISGPDKMHQKSDSFMRTEPTETKKAHDRERPWA
jgi:hypothetical protein